MLYSDISENIEDWAEFYWIATDEEFAERKKELKKLLFRLKELIDEQN